jgi:hypothetical protein
MGIPSSDPALLAREQPFLLSSLPAARRLRCQGFKVIQRNLERSDSARPDISGPGRAAVRLLVGREGELQRLTRLLERALGGEGGIGVIAGAPGAGKTRLLEELSERALSLGFVAAWGRGWELGNPPSYWPWIEIFRCLVTRPGGRDGASVLRGLLPAIDGQAGQAERTLNADVFQLYDAADRYLAEAAAREPVLLVLDDLHAADASSLQLGEFLMRQLRGRRLVLLGSHRQVELRRHPELQRSLARLARDAERCELGGLSEDDVQVLLRATSGAEDARQAREIHSMSDGNPLFVHELLRLPPAERASKRGELPEGIRSLLRERLAEVDQSQLGSLQAAAIVGRQFAPWLAAEVAGVPPAALDLAVGAAARADLIAPAGQGEWRFTHALMAETLVSELTPFECAASHRRAAEALERRHANPAAAPWNEIAHHWLAAGPDAAPRALDAAARAAACAAASLAFADAARFYEQALEALAIAAPGDTARRGEFLVGAAEAHVLAGERARAEEICARAVALGRLLQDGELLGRAALALGTEAMVGSADGPVCRYLEEALRLLPPGDSALRARVTARLASARQPDTDPSGPMQLARDAIAMAERLAEPEVLLHTLHSGLGALMDFAPAEERLPLNRKALHLARALGDRQRALRASVRLSFDRIELGDVRGFESALSEHAALAAELDQPRHRWVLPMFRSMRANWEGRFADADRLEREARALRDQGSAEGAALIPARPLVNALLRRDSAALNRAVTQLLGRSPDDRLLAGLFSALLASVRGQLHVAAREVATLAAQGIPPFGAARAGERATDEQSGPVSGYVHLTEITSEIAWSLRDSRLARTLYDELLPQAGRPFVITATAYSLHGVVDHALLRLGSLVQRPARVDEHAASALALCARLGAAPVAAAVQHDWAQVLLERVLAGGDCSDFERARELASSATATARALGMHELAEASSTLEARLRAAPPAPQRAPAPLPSSAPRSTPGATSAPQLLLALRLQLDGDVWAVSAGADTVHVRDTRGMHMLAQLVENAGRELHVLELSGAQDAVDAGDAGEVLDREAQRAYAARIRELGLELQEASSWNDLGRRERLLAEAELLERELSRAFGKGGRERRTASAVERARINVRRRLTVALEHIERASPELALRLRADLRTGVYCVYQPKG